ncbi:hypothetical protein [Candidatus Soleaferrea massiliensis]|uniref:hypothetical protein n=1 Tax=Candidatus Soleaferrea massiliensis TaxID=1470354 RepID=UPI00058EF506|nr:hypothetical protein [Candidatus Soleaferrea massiliensis]
MLGKLLKYEFKATARSFLPLYAALIVMSLINKLLFSINSNFLNGAIGIPQSISAMLYGFLIIAVFVLTVIVMIQRFYKNLLSDEGYLMFTLPVKTPSLIFSKLINATVWMLCSIAVTVVSVLILAYSPGMFSDLAAAIVQFFRNVDLQLGINVAAALVEFILMVLTTILSSVLMIYASIALGQLMNKHRVLASFGAYLVLNTVMSTIFMIGMMILGLINPDYFMFHISGEAALHLIMWGLILYNLVCCAAYYVITHIMLKKHLNLE